MRSVTWWGLARWVREFVGPRAAFVVGRVTDGETGRPIAGAAIATVIDGPPWQFPRSTALTEMGIATNADGWFEDLNIQAPGRYAITVVADGYRRETQSARATSFGVVRLDFALTRA